MPSSSNSLLKVAHHHLAPIVTPIATPAIQAIAQGLAPIQTQKKATPKKKSKLQTIKTSLRKLKKLRNLVKTLLRKEVHRHHQVIDHAGAETAVRVATELRSGGCMWEHIKAKQ